MAEGSWAGVRAAGLEINGAIEYSATAKNTVEKGDLGLLTNMEHSQSGWENPLVSPEFKTDAYAFISDSPYRSGDTSATSFYHQIAFMDEDDDYYYYIQAHDSTSNFVLLNNIGIHKITNEIIRTNDFDKNVGSQRNFFDVCPVRNGKVLHFEVDTSNNLKINEITISGAGIVTSSKGTLATGVEQNQIRARRISEDKIVVCYEVNDDHVIGIVTYDGVSSYSMGTPVDTNYTANSSQATKDLIKLGENKFALTGTTTTFVFDVTGDVITYGNSVSSAGSFYRLVPYDDGNGLVIISWDGNGNIIYGLLCSVSGNTLTTVASPQAIVSGITYSSATLHGASPYNLRSESPIGGAVVHFLGTTDGTQKKYVFQANANGTFTIKEDITNDEYRGEWVATNSTMATEQLSPNKYISSYYQTNDKYAYVKVWEYRRQVTGVALSGGTTGQTIQVQSWE